MSKKEEQKYEEYESLKNSKFKQQKLPGWRPVPSILRTTAVFFSLGIVFAGLGVLILIFSNDTVELVQQYNDKCKKTGDICNITFPIEKKMKKNIMVYFQLNGFYQNHRRFIKSKNEKIQDSLLAKMYYKISLKLFINEKLETINDTYIARKSDRDKNEGIDEHLLVWMRQAPFHNFNKLYGRIEKDIEKNDDFIIEITQQYKEPYFDSLDKYIIIRTVNNFGCKNMWLSIGYMVFGGACLILGIIFFIGYKTKMKKEK